MKRIDESNWYQLTDDEVTKFCLLELGIGTHFEGCYVEAIDNAKKRVRLGGDELKQDVMIPDKMYLENRSRYEVTIVDGKTAKRLLSGVDLDYRFEELRVKLERSKQCERILHQLLDDLDGLSDTYDSAPAVDKAKKALERLRNDSI